jgi:hypothetical protein
MCLSFAESEAWDVLGTSRLAPALATVHLTHPSACLCTCGKGGLLVRGEQSAVHAAIVVEGRRATPAEVLSCLVPIGVFLPDGVRWIFCSMGNASTILVVRSGPRIVLTFVFRPPLSLTLEMAYTAAEHPISHICFLFYLPFFLSFPKYHFADT